MTVQRTWPSRTATRARNRQAFLAAAQEMLAMNGYADCSLSALAARAGLSTGAVYTIFGSKAELFLELLHDGAHLPGFEQDLDSYSDMAEALSAFGRQWAQRINSPDARKMLELSYELQLAALREPALLVKVAQAQHNDTAHFASQLQDAASRRRETLRRPAQDLAADVIAALQGLSEQAVLLGHPADPERFGAVARRLLAP